MLTELQKRSVQAIVNIFETGKVLGDYGCVTLLPGDSGHLTYGRSQTTLASGNLYLLVAAYCAADGATLADALRPYLSRLEFKDLTLDHDTAFRGLLYTAGDDPVMAAVQDAFFDRIYWAPAVASAAHIGSGTPLGMAVVYDSRIHGHWHALRDQTIREFGTLTNTDERSWMQAYVTIRRSWLANHSNALLHRTVYRIDALQALIDLGNWALDLPFTVRGLTVDESSLAGATPVRASAEVVEARVLRLRQPMMQGEDVRELQNALVEDGASIERDGVFGNATDAAVRDFQERKGMVNDGIAGPATLAALKIRV